MFLFDEVAVTPNYRRNFVTGGCYFFTVNLLERQRTLLTDHIDLFAQFGLAGTAFISVPH